MYSHVHLIIGNKVPAPQCTCMNVCMCIRCMLPELQKMEFTQWPCTKLLQQLVRIGGSFPGTSRSLAQLQSSFKNKEPLRHICRGKLCTDNASQTPYWHFHGWFFFLFLHISFFIHYFTNPLTFEEFSELFPASLFCSSMLFFYYFFLLAVSCSVSFSWFLWWQCTSQE